MSAVQRAWHTDTSGSGPFRGHCVAQGSDVRRLGVRVLAVGCRGGSAVAVRGGGRSGGGGAGLRVRVGVGVQVRQHLLAEAEEVGGEEADDVADGQAHGVDGDRGADALVALDQGEEGPAGRADGGGADGVAELVEQADEAATEGATDTGGDEGAAERE